MNILKKSLLGLCLGGMLCFGTAASAGAATSDYLYTPKTQTAAPTETPAVTSKPVAEIYKDIGSNIVKNNKINATVIVLLSGALLVVMIKNKTLIQKRRKK